MTQATGWVHELKTLAPHFEAIAAGAKRFELRRNDRGFGVGDSLRLREYTGSEYTGRELTVRVTQILYEHEGLALGYACMSIEVQRGES